MCFEVLKPADVGRGEDIFRSWEMRQIVEGVTQSSDLPSQYYPLSYLVIEGGVEWHATSSIRIRHPAQSRTVAYKVSYCVE